MSDQDDTTQAGLPMQVIGRSDSANPEPTRQGPRKPGIIRRLLPLLMVPVLLFCGAIIGLYFQPPGPQKFFELTGMKPGGGSDTPFAIPPEIDVPQDMLDTMQISDVVGLARLIPNGDISPVAAPSGAGDARISEILVTVGDVLTKGQVVARLDNLAQLESAVLGAQAIVGVREATLMQVRQSVQNSLNEARAVLEQAEAAAEVAKSDRVRAEELFERQVTTKAALNTAQSVDRQANRAVEKARATLARFASDDIHEQPDVIVAARNLDAALVDLGRARLDLDRARVVAPIAGVVLDIHARPGEHPPLKGIMEMGDTSQMMAEVEVYQDRIALVQVGQPVEIVAPAIGRTLTGVVTRIGLIVGRQELISNDTAANLDARVFEVLVRLDPDASRVAARYTNLEAVARIDTRTGPENAEPAE
ncbi:MAG: HlyD family efflux transporter periplasmic adaptor subunit [Rhodobacteraceae bacterium]|nr:HlyD family efflux transporter periplasmic adaptor subunit [Paracoccaceae bacterium]